MTVQIDTTAENSAVRLQNVATPASPATGHALIFSRGDGLYYESASGTVIGPLSTGTVMSASAGIPVGGWIADLNTWSYLSADSPSFVASVNANVTGTIFPGTRLNLTQTTEKFFIVTAVSITGSTTYVNMYGGTDYSLANASITSPQYSPVKAPARFPLDPTKWTVSITDTNQNSQNSPTTNTWYNLGSLSISIPIGEWYVSYQNAIQISGNEMQCTLSTANNSESDTDFTAYGFSGGGITMTFVRFKILLLTVKTVYYLNARTQGSGASFIQTRGNNSKTIISATCAYL